MRDTPKEKDRVTNERVTLSFLYGSFLIEESLPTPLRGELPMFARLERIV